MASADKRPPGKNVDNGRAAAPPCAVSYGGLSDPTTGTGGDDCITLYPISGISCFKNILIRYLIFFLSLLIEAHFIFFMLLQYHDFDIF